MRRALAIAAIMACSRESPPPPPAPSPCGPPERIHTGEATHYAADGTGKCSFPRVSSPLVAAASVVDFAEAASCGSCVVVIGPDDDELIVQIVDRCPACKPGDLDLSREAFELLAPRAKGRIRIRWLPVPCQVEGPLAYQFKHGSNAQWAAIQVRNHRYPIAALAARDDRGTFRVLERTAYNFFVGKGLGAGPYTLRVTDARGQTHVDTGVTGPVHTGSAQFPRCP